MPQLGGAPAANRRRNRIFYNPEQVDQMEAAFAVNQYPDFKSRQELAAEIGLTEDRIQVWFQNRRDRLKRQAKKKKSGSQPKRPRRTLFTKEFMPPNLTSPRSSPEVPSSPEVIDLSTSVPASSPELPSGPPGISSFMETPSLICPSSISPTLPVSSSLPLNEPPLQKASDICREVIDWSTSVPVPSPELLAKPSLMKQPSPVCPSSSSPTLPIPSSLLELSSVLPGISSFVEPPSPVCPSSTSPTLPIPSSLPDLPAGLPDISSFMEPPSPVLPSSTSATLPIPSLLPELPSTLPGTLSFMESHSSILPSSTSPTLPIPSQLPELQPTLTGISAFMEPPSPILPSSTSPTLPIPSSLPFWDEPCLPPLQKASDLCREVSSYSSPPDIDINLSPSDSSLTELKTCCIQDVIDMYMV